MLSHPGGDFTSSCAPETVCTPFFPEGWKAGRRGGEARGGGRGAVHR